MGKRRSLVCNNDKTIYYGGGSHDPRDGTLVEVPESKHLTKYLRYCFRQCSSPKLYNPRRSTNTDQSIPKILE